jgi:hypothetical protein
METISMSGPFHTLRGTVLEIGAVRNSQQEKKCVYNILCDRCYVGETSRALEVLIKVNRRNLMKGLLETPKIA